jgi:hypothetical protein
MNARNHLSTKVLGLVVSIVVPTLSACGGGGGTPLTVTTYCSQWATAQCGIAVSCVSTMADCETAATAQCMSQATAAQASGVRVFTPGNVSRCVSETTTVYKKMSGITLTDLATVADDCNYVFQGAVAKMKPCTTKYDCTGGLGSTSCDKGVCATPATKAKGVDCSGPGEICATGSYCAKDTADMFYTCLAKGAAAAACDAATPCVEALHCVAGKCVTRAGQGELCATNDDCSTTAPYCDPYAGYKCAASLSFSSGSTSCTEFFTPPAPPTSNGTAGTSGGTAGAGGGDAAAGASGGTAGADGAAGVDGSDASTTDAGDAATTG